MPVAAYVKYLHKDVRCGEVVIAKSCELCIQFVSTP